MAGIYFCGFDVSKYDNDHSKETQFKRFMDFLISTSHENRLYDQSFRSSSRRPSFTATSKLDSLYFSKLSSPSSNTMFSLSGSKRKPKLTHYLAVYSPGKRESRLMDLMVLSSLKMRMEFYACSLAQIVWVMAPMLRMQKMPLGFFFFLGCSQLFNS